MTGRESLLSRREFMRGLGGAGLCALCPGFLKSEEEWQARVAFISGDVYIKHNTGQFAFENAGRLKAISDGLTENGLWPRLRRVDPRPATLDWVETVHRPEYIATVKSDVESGAKQLSTGHTLLSRDSFDVALWAVGAALSACDEVMRGNVDHGFCAIRPPGHHAGADRGMGFCIFNNAAIAARYLQKHHGLNRVLIIDWDLHHGNGTQEIFYRDGTVFYFSTHQWPWYPWTGRADETGEAEGKGTTLNVPLPAGSGDGELLAALEERLRPAMDRFRPEFVLISAGFDSRTGDPLGRFRVTDQGYKSLTRVAAAIARDHAASRLVSLLEGGYNLDGLAKAVSAHIQVLLET
jgi:acetoin utilization deacetylase AcuC-like enzyme